MCQAGQKHRATTQVGGVSPAISVTLMAAIVIILAAVIGAFVLGLGEETEEPAPVVTAELDREVVDSNVAGNERIIIKHENGDTVPVSELRIITEAECPGVTRRGELTNLPVDTSTPVYIGNENINGDPIFATNALVTAPLASDDGTWEAGERLEFQLDKNECPVQDKSTIAVEVIHEPTNSRIVDESFGSGAQPLSFDFSLDDSVDPNLKVEVTSGSFNPTVVDMTVEVDGGGSSASRTGTMEEFDASAVCDPFPTDFDGQNEVGSGDALAVDISCGSFGSGAPGPSGFGFGPLSDNSGTTTDVEVTIKFKGDEIASATLEASDFEVNP